MPSGGHLPNSAFLIRISHTQARKVRYSTDFDQNRKISDFPGLSMGIFVSKMLNSVSVRPRAPHELANDVWCAGFGRRGAWQQGEAREDDLQANCGRNLPQICPRFAGYGHFWPSLWGTKEGKTIGHWGIGVQGGTCRCCFTPNVQFYSSDFE